MSAGAAIAGITKDIVFSTRRADRAANESSVPVAIGNADIATAQIKNAVGGAEIALKDSNSVFAVGLRNTQSALKAAADSNAVTKSVGKVVTYTADHINPVITGVGAIKVLCSDDKESAAIQEAAALGTMFTFEGAAKNILEMSKKQKNAKGEYEFVNRRGFYRDIPILNAQVEKMEAAVKEFCQTKSFLRSPAFKHAPCIVKGLMFVGASIGGYQLGTKIGKKINEARKGTETNKSELNTSDTAPLKVQDIKTDSNTDI